MWREETLDQIQPPLHARQADTVSLCQHVLGRTCFECGNELCYVFST